MHKEQLLGRQQYLTYIKRLDACLGVSRGVLMLSARLLNPVELQLQAVCDILYHQKLRYYDNKQYDRTFPTRAPFRNSLGLKLASDLEQLIDEFEKQKDESSGTTMSLASLLFSKYQESDSLRKLEVDAFQLLSRHWHDANYLVPNNEHLDQGDTIAMHSMGKDVGSEAVPYLVDQDFNESSMWDWILPNKTEIRDGIENLRPNRVLSLSTLDKIDRDLKKYGIAVIRNVFDKGDIQEIRHALHLKSSLARDAVFKIIETDPNVSALKYTRGRIHCMLRGTSFDRLLAPLQRFWIPVVYYTLGRSVYISNIQLISSDVMSFVEPWHRNNCKFGITVVVALDDINEKNGRVQFLPGTHSKSSEVDPYKTGVSNHSYSNHNVGKVAIDLKSGDVLIFDSRILHRYTINDSNRCQSCLVYAYDYRSTKPPGQGMIQQFI
ncbi:hypothetical protein X943_000908 [Babesia divergens]|uniref:Phytanoyl-CoA dioxygenase n=1 Tax=Babesia divergens TaxID=32595 RepID=A0AAD9LGX9_BABDI|nr:hypothetical protein X943_000908 [Babesia divergens]